MNSDNDLFDDDEFKVAEILLELPQLIAQERDGILGSPFPSSWGVEGKQSAIDSSPSTPPPFSILLHHSCNGIMSLSSWPCESDSRKMSKQELHEVIQHLTEDIRKLKQVSSCGEQKKKNLNSNPRAMTGLALEESNSQALAEREEEEEVAVRVPKKAVEFMERLTPEVGTSENRAAIAAQARRMRIEILRSRLKSSTGSVKPR
ncbi:hypothetical protein NE237_016640 [Protea cynaroides]|uniref:Uncharacterized protein n=1 Tax=Protea cynaroides TaxID=273540 RepID=A0A9Q0HDV5_9MAGN|nr:hypothetical protein NE237_016640 [Protea cynaroides]